MTKKNELRQAFQSINRTMVELKLQNGKAKFNATKAINHTMVELKWTMKT